MTTCTCHPLSAFRWREHQRPSAWANDSEVTYTAKSGKTRSQIGSETKAQIEERLGHPINEIRALSKRSRA